MATAKARRSAGRVPQDGILTSLFSSRTRIRLLSHFFLHPKDNFYIRQLERLLDEPVGKLRPELLNLEGIGILLSWHEGNQRRYQLNQDFPIYEELRSIFLKTAGLGDIIRKHLAEVKGVELAFIYGSYAKGEERADSDVDVMVVGEASTLELSTAFRKMEQELRREVNYSLFDREEVKQRLGEGIGFIPSVFSGPRMIIKGDGDDELFRHAPAGASR